MEKEIDIKTNWETANEKNLSNILSVKSLKENRQRIDTDEVITEDSVLLKHESNSNVILHCEVRLKIPAAHMISSFTLICECPKLELFLGNQEEYIQTYFGNIEDDFEGIKVYRFDIEINRVQINTVVMKLIPGQQQFWMFGMVCFLAPSQPSISPAPKFNLQNVEHLLSNSSHKLSPNAEKCKEFLETHLSNKGSNTAPDMQTIMAALSTSLGGLAMGNATVDIGVPSSRIKTDGRPDNHKLQNLELKEYVDAKFKDLLQQQTLEFKEYFDAKFKDLQQQNLKLQEFNNCIAKVFYQIISYMEFVDDKLLKQNKKIDEMLQLLQNKAEQ